MMGDFVESVQTLLYFRVSLRCNVQCGIQIELGRVHPGLIELPIWKHLFVEASYVNAVDSSCVTCPPTSN